MKERLYRSLSWPLRLVPLQVTIQAKRVFIELQKAIETSEIVTNISKVVKTINFILPFV